MLFLSDSKPVWSLEFFYFINEKSEAQRARVLVRGCTVSWARVRSKTQVS